MSPRARNQSSFEPSSPEQLEAANAIDSHDVVFLIGPAGTGKTHVAVTMAVKMITSGKFTKLVVCRPIVESGEKLGHLPGTFEDKVDPYLVPVTDLLAEFEFQSQYKDWVEKVPIAYMRGRTFTNRIVILDEAQNTTPQQMKMVLTRLGKNSKLIITGDPDQSDLPSKQLSGLDDAVKRLKTVDGVSFVRFSEAASNNRHPLVPHFIEAYR